jgi:nucleoside-diphosphate-sugar epimerase
MKKRALVAGAGGFIGGHLSRKLKDMGYDVRCVDKKPLTNGTSYTMIAIIWYSTSI